ncbi:MAG: hypothetical protein VX951_14040 [Planctomycetota bacterium]|nr:hypothetical protein [Planctomycetota bacterium]
MNKTLFLALLVVLVGAACAFFVWAGSEATTVTPNEPIAWTQDETPDLASPVAVGESEAVAEDSDESEETPAGLLELSRQELEGERGNLRYLVVQVWNGKRGVPAPDTDVFFLDGYEGPELEDPFAQHPGDLTEAHGQRFKTDAKGRVELPAVQKRAMVSAQREGMYGFTKIGRRHRRVETITLRVDETVTVRVVGDEDRPVAGVPVGVAQRVPMRKNLTEIEGLTAKMQELERQAAQVERYVRANPAQKERAQFRIKQIREQQGTIKSELARTKKGSSRRSGDRRRRGSRQRSGDRQRRGAADRQPPKYLITTRSDVRARRRTDAEGIAVFRHFQTYRRYQETWWPQQHVDQFEAVLLMPLHNPEASDFSGRPVPTETVELRMPPTGSIALRMVDLEGRPFTHPVHVDLRMQAEQAVSWARLQKRKEQNRSEIVFPFIGLGLQFTAHCRLDDDDFRWKVPSIAGPSNPGERVTVDVVVAPTEGMLFGRLLDNAGQPLAGLRPSFLINTSVGRLEGEDVTTDKDGRFHLPYQVRDKHQPPYRLEIRNKGVRPVAGLAMRLPGLPAARVTDLGDLQLDGFGAIAYGVVMNDRGEPIKGASLQLQRERQMGGEQLKMAFVDEAFVVGRSDAEGRYEMFGELEPGRYRLRVTARGHFTLNSNDLRTGSAFDLQLLRNSQLVGTVLTPSWLRSSDLRTVLESELGAKKRRDDRIHFYRGKKFIYFERVPPGSYTVSIRLKGFPDPIYRASGLQILPGQTEVHPRLLDIDLGSFLHRFELTAVNQHGQPIKPRWPLIAKIMRPSGQTSFVGFPWKGSKLEIISASPDLEVTPFDYGHLAEPALLPMGTSEVRFVKLPPVELRLPGLRRLVGQALVWVKLQPVKGTGIPRQLEMWDDASRQVGRQFGGLQRRNFGVLLGQGDTVQIPMMMVGQFKVTVYLLGTTKNRKTRGIRLELGEVNVRLAPGAGPQRVAVNVDAKKVQDALAELVQREAAAGAKGTGR